MSGSHVSVLVDEICLWLNINEQGIYVDCTLGAGGTSKKILELAGEHAVVIAMDRDPEAIILAKENLKKYQSSMRIFNGNFSHIGEFIEKSGFEQVDGIVFDLGVSSMQLDQPERGFSFMQDGPLDMRMDKRQTLTAEGLVNHMSEKDLADLIFQFGEERFARRIARAIIGARSMIPIRTTRSLVQVIEGAVPARYRRGRVHPATRTFQALRIAVNRELEVLEGALRAAIHYLKVGARLCVVSFHSLEDRIVKHTFRSLGGKESPIIKILTKKPILPRAQEIANNPRARSAKLRVVERLEMQKDCCL